jgi:hypothetical protein
METKYKQVKIKYKDGGGFEISWIPEVFARVNKSIEIGTTTRYPATVVEVLSGDKSYTKDCLELNRDYPLWKVTDI